MNAHLLLAQSTLPKEEGGDCVANNGFCPTWIEDNLHDYVTPLIQHAYLTAIIVGIGFAISFTLAVMAHRRRWLTGPFIGFTGALYTVPSIGAFILLIPITGLGTTSVLIVMVSYTLLILFRNITLGLRNVPADTVDAGKGMGLTSRQLLWRVELPLALPEIFAGLRVAATTTVGLLTLSYLGGSNLGMTQFFSSPDQLSFKSNVVVAGVICLLLAAVFDVLLLLAQKLSTPWIGAER